MCQYACFPAPKTVTSCTDCRFLMSIVLASAVRKAVNSSALMSAVGAPELSKSVKDPLGVVLSELMIEEGGLTTAELDVDVLLTVVLTDGRGEEDRDEEFKDSLSRLAALLCFSGAASVTILTPIPS